MANFLDCRVCVQNFVDERQSLNRDEHLSVQIAQIGDIDFSLCVYPNGDDESDDGYAAMLLDAQSERTLRCTAYLNVVSKPHSDEPHIQLPECELCDGDVFGDENINSSWYPRWGEANAVNVAELEEGGFVSDGHLYIRLRLLYVCGRDHRTEPPVLPAFPEQHSVQKATLVEDLGKIIGEGDITLLVNHVSLKAHKAILGARSPVFRAMLCSEMVESRGSIKIDDLSLQAIERMLMFMYTAKLTDNLSVNELAELAVAGDKYGVNTLRDAAIQAIQNMLDPSNLAHVLAIADQKGLTSLRQHCLDMAARSEKMRFGVQDSQAFGKLSGDLVRSLCLVWSGKRPREGDHEFPEGSNWQSLSFTQLTRACKERGIPIGSQAEMIALLVSFENTVDQ
mmetsp:Transcript_51170/g.91125  ORF Transcript_51170/g.91125 Transcript_51170/m.91125 type:complete len:395 (+) Transcript_51170:90-1274(+)